MTDQPIDARMVSARDSAMAGWYDKRSGELCPGYFVGGDDVVADIGCGGGGNAMFCAERGAKVIIADIDAANLAQARAGLQSVNPPAPFEAVLTDGRRLPIEDAIASRVICTEVIEHAEDPAALLAELARIGRPGAHYLLSCPAPGAEAVFKRIAHPSYFEPPNHIHIIGNDELAALVENAGLTIERRFNGGFYMFFRWVFFWSCPPLSGDMRHELLDSWDRTWSLLMEQETGPLTKRVLDDMLPKSQMILARKL